MRNRCFALGFVLFVSIGLYWQLGAWQALSTQRWIKLTEIALSEKTKQAATREQLIEWLHQRAENMPDNPEVWSVMAEYALLLQDYPQALAWSEKALQAAADNPSVMLQYIQIAFPADAGKFTAHSRGVLQRLAALEPAHPSVLNFLAMDAFATGHYEVAKRIWLQLLQQLPPDSDILPTLYKALQEVDTRLLNTAPSEKRIRLHLEHVVELKQRRLATDYVFISVRQPAVSMPIWVRKLRLSDLKSEVMLSAADAMVAGNSLDTASEITVSMKVTASPDPLQWDEKAEVFVSELFDTNHKEIDIHLNLK